MAIHYVIQEKKTVYKYTKLLVGETTEGTHHYVSSFLPMVLILHKWLLPHETYLRLFQLIMFATLFQKIILPFASN